MRDALTAVITLREFAHALQCSVTHARQMLSFYRVPYRRAMGRQYLICVDGAFDALPQGHAETLAKWYSHFLRTMGGQNDEGKDSD